MADIFSNNNTERMNTHMQRGSYLETGGIITPHHSQGINSSFFREKSDQHQQEQEDEFVI